MDGSKQQVDELNSDPHVLKPRRARPRGKLAVWLIAALVVVGILGTWIDGEQSYRHCLSYHDDQYSLSDVTQKDVWRPTKTAPARKCGADNFVPSSLLF